MKAPTPSNFAANFLPGFKKIRAGNSNFKDALSKNLWRFSPFFLIFMIFTTLKIFVQFSNSCNFWNILKVLSQIFKFLSIFTNFVDFCNFCRFSQFFQLLSSVKIFVNFSHFCWFFSPLSIFTIFKIFTIFVNFPAIPVGVNPKFYNTWKGIYVITKKHSPIHFSVAPFPFDDDQSKVFQVHVDRIKRIHVKQLHINSKNENLNPQLLFG